MSQLNDELDELIKKYSKENQVSSSTRFLAKLFLWSIIIYALWILAIIPLSLSAFTIRMLIGW
jgi:hypothetical protein